MLMVCWTRRTQPTVDGHSWRLLTIEAAEGSDEGCLSQPGRGRHALVVGLGSGQAVPHAMACGSQVRDEESWWAPSRRQGERGLGTGWPGRTGSRERGQGASATRERSRDAEVGMAAGGWEDRVWDLGKAIFIYLGYYWAGLYKVDRWKWRFFG